MKKFAIFDFDKTITDRDSIKILWKTYGKKMGARFILQGISIGISFIGYKFTGDFNPTKNKMAKIFDYLTEEDIDEFVNEVLPKYYYKDALEELEELKKDGFELLLVSASYENYMKKVGDNLGFDFVIGTRLGRLNELIGNNNRREEKVARIESYLENTNEAIDYDNSRSYSDSYRDDKYMMELTANRYLINSNVREEGFRNLVWK